MHLNIRNFNEMRLLEEFGNPTRAPKIIILNSASVTQVTNICMHEKMGEESVTIYYCFPIVRGCENEVGGLCHMNH